MGASLRPALPEMPWTLGRSHGQLGPQERIATHTHGLRSEHPLVAAAGNVASTLDHSPTLPAFPRQYLTTCPHGSRPKEGVAGDQKKARPSFSGLRLPPNCLCPGHSLPAPEETQGDDPSDSRGRRKGCGGSRYLPVPQVRDRRAGHTTTLGRNSSGAKQAFIAALAARLRRRAAQRIPRLEGIVVLLPGAPGWTRGKGLYFPEAL